MNENIKQGVKDTMKDVSRVLDSQLVKKVIKLILLLVAFVLIFGAGVAVGFHKSSFGRAWGEHYGENFGIGHRGPMMGGLGGDMMADFPNAHGAVGKIIKIELPTVIVQDKDGTEKVVLIQDQTSIEQGKNILKSEDLKLDDFVVVIGAPDAQGQIEAKLIRLIPAPQFVQ